MTHPDWQSKLLAAASSASAAATDMIEAVRDGEINKLLNVGSGETTECLADSLRLLIEAIGDDNDTQLFGALVKYLDERA